MSIKSRLLALAIIILAASILTRTFLFSSILRPLPHNLTTPQLPPETIQHFKTILRISTQSTEYRHQKSDFVDFCKYDFPEFTIASAQIWRPRESRSWMVEIISYILVRRLL